MTDRIECPDCEGTGKQVIGPLVLACRFCQGLGYVGDDNEPAEDPPDPDPAEERFWVRNDHRVKGTTPCDICLGTRKVVNLSDGDGDNTGRLIELPCPACTPPGDETG